jgi:hypothetical protein
MCPVYCPYVVLFLLLAATWLFAQRGKQTKIDFNCPSQLPLSSSRFVRLAKYQSDGITELDKG